MDRNRLKRFWIPACAGMTETEGFLRLWIGTRIGTTLAAMPFGNCLLEGAAASYAEAALAAKAEPSAPPGPVATTERRPPKT